MHKPQPATNQVKPLIPSTEVWSICKYTILQQYSEWEKIYPFSTVTQLAKEYIHAGKCWDLFFNIHEWYTPYN